MLKIKLMRIGKKNQARFRIVVSESRSKANGKYNKVIGFYDPTTEPSTVKLDKNSYLDLLEKGAQPTLTVRRLFEKYEKVA